MGPKHTIILLSGMLKCSHRRGDSVRSVRLYKVSWRLYKVSCLYKVSWFLLQQGSRRFCRVWVATLQIRPQRLVISVSPRGSKQTSDP